MTSLSDWLDNFNTGTTTITGSRTVHSGFVDHERRVSSCLMGHVNTLNGWQIGVDYIAGHSLGGAAAVVFAEDHMVRKRGRGSESKGERKRERERVCVCVFVCVCR